jgi:hypothetical protein
MSQLTFKEQIIAQYLIVEKEETTAGWKDLLKQGMGIIISGLLFSQSAFGFHLKEDSLKKLETNMKKSMHSFTMDKNANTEGAKYDYKIDYHKDGNVQTVSFKVLKDGKVAGQVNFAGTPTSDTSEQNSMRASVSNEAENDEIVNYIVDVQTKSLQKMINKDLPFGDK